MYRDIVTINLGNLKTHIEEDYLYVLNVAKEAIVLGMAAYAHSKDTELYEVELVETQLESLFALHRDGLKNDEHYVIREFKDMDRLEGSITDTILMRTDNIFERFVRKSRDTYIDITLDEQYLLHINFVSFPSRNQMED